MKQKSSVTAWARKALVPVLVALFVLGTGISAMAQTPPAGSVIGNQASATYTDENNVVRTVTSNLVTTTVTQVAGVLVDQDLAKIGAPGGQISYPITVTNTGNGPDSFTLSSAQSGDFVLASCNFFVDANGDGVPDNNTPITTTGSLPAGGIFQLVSVCTIPGTATVGQVSDLTVTAVSVYDGGVDDAATLTTTVGGGAIIDVTKSIVAASGNPGTGPYTVQLTYTNTGNDTASALTLTDALPSGMIYQGNSGRWSATGTNILSDLDDADVHGAPPNTIVYDYGVTVPGQVTAVISGVAPGQSGLLTFEVDIAAGQPAGILANVARYSYDDGSGPVGPFDTNTFSFLVNQVAAVSVTPDTVATAVQGTAVSFANVITNDGNGTDTFDISLSGSNFPAGTAFSLYQGDGVTPLIDTDGNSIPDTGPLAAGASYTVVLVANLPPNASGGPFSVNKIATSIVDAGVSDSGTDVLQSITVSTVDLTNDAAGGGAPGAGAGPEPAPVTTVAADPGTDARFTLFANNTSGAPDSYILEASADSSFATLTLPAGWVVTFRNTLLNPVTTTGSIAGGAAAQIFADVSVPANQAPVPLGQSVYFRIRSSNTGATDRKHDAVIVNTVRSLTLVPNQVGQTFPGGTVTYSHTLTNGGNVVENGGASTVSLGLADSGALWSSLVYIDINQDGNLDPGDSLITVPAELGALAPGASLDLLVKVTAPPGATPGDANTTTLTASASGVINGTLAPAAASVDDYTTVVSGNIVVQKLQALDVDCNGVADSPFVSSSLTAPPGACIRYRITVTNVGTVTATGVSVNDSTPANSAYFFAGPGDQASISVGSITAAPANGGTGNISASIGNLLSGQSAVLTFGVQINP